MFVESILKKEGRRVLSLFFQGRESYDDVLLEIERFIESVDCDLTVVLYPPAIGSLIFKSFLRIPYLKKKEALREICIALAERILIEDELEVETTLMWQLAGIRLIAEPVAWRYVGPLKLWVPVAAVAERDGEKVVVRELFSRRYVKNVLKVPFHHFEISGEELYQLRQFVMNVNGFMPRECLFLLAENGWVPVADITPFSEARRAIL